MRSRNRGVGTVHPRVLGDEHVVGHCAVRVPLVTEDVLRLTHPVGTFEAISAVSARENLLDDDSVAQLKPTCCEGGRVACGDSPGDLVAGDHVRLCPSGPCLVSPVPACPVEALDIACTNTHRFDL